MKKTILLTILCGLAFNGFGITPGFYGARSLSLGFGATAFNYDINSLFINPSILSSMSYTLWGYQYQHSYMDYKNFGEDLSTLLENNLKNFEGLNESDKTTLFSSLKDLFQSKAGITGFRANIPGFAAKNYGLSVSMVNTALVNPVKPADNFFNRPIETVTNSDIASLQMRFIGLKYKQISLAYSLDLHQSISVGLALHYLNGKVTEFNSAIVENIFTRDATPKDYLEHGWNKAENKFSKLVTDAGILVNLVKYFNLGLVYRNFAAAKIKTPLGQISLNKRLVAGLAFKPDMQWGVYVDVDLKKSDLYYNGQEFQPISLGVEKGFFTNKFFIRVGMLNDLTEKRLLGKKSNALYGIGIGFNMEKFVIDAGLGIDSRGMVKSLAVSGFIVMK